MLGHADGAVKMWPQMFDRAARLHSSFAGPMMMQNAQPPSDLLDRVPSVARNLERRWSKSTVHKLAKPTKY